MKRLVQECQALPAAVSDRYRKLRGVQEACDDDFGLWINRVPEHVTTRKTQRRIHAGDRQRSSHGLYPSRSYNADRAGLVDLELCMRRAAAEVVVNQHRT